MIRTVLVLLMTGAAMAAATAQQRPAAGQGRAIELGKFGDWTAYRSPDGQPRSCYIVSSPKERNPRTLQRDPGFLFVTARPDQRVRNEVSFVVGFPTRETAAGELAVGSSRFVLAPSGRNAFLANAAEEGAFITAARGAQSLTATVTSGRGNPSTDRYSLQGFAQAMDRLRRECP
jgi:hypothetical protein